MKVLVAEFTIFSGIYWKSVSYKITATSLKELEVAVLNELQWMAAGSVTAEKKWEQIQSNIIETVLEFPIVETYICD